MQTISKVDYFKKLNSIRMWNSNPDHLFGGEESTRRKHQKADKSSCVHVSSQQCPFLNGNGQYFFIKLDSQGINVSNLNSPGKGLIDRMIYDCHSAVIEINAKEPRSCKAVWIPLKTLCLNCRLQLPRGCPPTQAPWIPSAHSLHSFEHSQNIPFTQRH